MPADSFRLTSVDLVVPILHHIASRTLGGPGLLDIHRDGSNVPGYTSRCASLRVRETESPPLSSLPRGFVRRYHGQHVWPYLL